MSNLENKKIARDCTIAALFFTLPTLAFTMTTGIVGFRFMPGALMFCVLVLILSFVALCIWYLNGRDNISCRIKKYLTAIVILLSITFVFLWIAMILEYYYYIFYFYAFYFAAATLNIGEIVLFSIVISLEKKAMSQKLSAETATKSLQDYKYLYENGLITQEEYDTQRERILSQLGL